MATVFNDINQSIETFIFPVASENMAGFHFLCTLHNFEKINISTDLVEGVRMKQPFYILPDKSWYLYYFLVRNDNEKETVLYFGNKNRDENSFIKGITRFKLSVLDVNYLPCFSGRFTSSDIRLIDNVPWSLIKIPNPRQFLIGDSLQCAVDCLLVSDNSEKMDVENEFQSKLENLNISLKLLKSQKKYSDVSFSVGDEQFELHKVILANRSEVFDKMFTDQKEIKNIIHLEDLTSDIFRELVHYIYTNSVTFSYFDNDKALELFKAAEVYKLPELKNFCEITLLGSLEVENAVTYFITAHNYTSDKIKKEATDVIRKNWKDIKNTVGWKEVEKNNELLLYLLDASFSQ